MVKVYQLNAFAAAEKGGNPAGVCLEENLTEEQMQAIARKIGFSETAFATKVEDGYEVRFFTPRKEIDVCGHATIATFSLLAQQGLPRGKYNMTSKAGVLEIEVGSQIWMHQGPPRFMGWRYSIKDEIADALRIDQTLISPDLPCEEISTGVPTLLVPVNSLEILLSLKPDIRAVERLTTRHYNCLLYVYTTETQCQGNTAHARMFAPGYGITEEPATGMAAGALAASLYSASRAIKDRIIEQGLALHRPSEIHVRLSTTDSGAITDVIVGGNAKMVHRIQFQ